MKGRYKNVVLYDNNVFNHNSMIIIMRRLDDVIHNEIDDNLSRTTAEIGKTRRTLPDLVKDFVRQGSVIEGVIGLYFGLNGEEINLLAVIETSEGEGYAEFDSRFYDIFTDIDLKLSRKYNLGNLNLQVVGSGGTLEDFEREDMQFHAFKDDKYIGKHVKRIYP